MDNTQLKFPDGPWKSLLSQAYTLFDTISNDGILILRWSLGGGTVLMFYYGHRKSKDIDIRKAVGQPFPVSDNRWP